MTVKPYDVFIIGGGISGCGIARDAAGRGYAVGLAEMHDLVEKIIGYETTPHMTDNDGNPDTDWFLRGAVMSNDQRTGYSSIYLQRWLRKMLFEVGFQEVDTLYFIHDIDQGASHEFMVNNFNEGISIFNYRGWGDFNGAWVIPNQMGELRNAEKLFMMVLPTCNTCDFADHNLHQASYAEEFLWANNGGAIGVIGFGQN